MANYHLVILAKQYLDAILAGKKTIESRFTKTRRAPFGHISVEDKLFLKVVSGPVCAEATAAMVKSFDNLTPTKIKKIKNQYNRLICGTDEYWRSISDCKFGSLIWLKSMRTIEPVRIGKKDWRGWVVLNERVDFGLVDSWGLI